MGSHVARQLRHTLAAGAAMALLVLLLAPLAHAASPSCVIPARSAKAAATTPSAPLRFGIYPGGPAGFVDPRAPPKAEDPVKRLAALQGLRSGETPFVVRLYSG